MTVFIIQNTIIYTIPLLIVALGGMFAERSGVINLALEGEMIFGAFMGAVAVYGFQMSGAMADTPQLMFIIAMIIAAASGAVFSLLLSFSAIFLHLHSQQQKVKCYFLSCAPKQLHLYQQDKEGFLFHLLLLDLEENLLRVLPFSAPLLQEILAAIMLPSAFPRLHAPIARYLSSDSLSTI